MICSFCVSVVVLLVRLCLLHQHLVNHADNEQQCAGGQLSPLASADLRGLFFFSFIISVFVSACSFSFRGPLSPGARRGVRLHAALCLCPLHPHRALGGAGGQGLHQLRQERLLGHRHLPHQALLRREGAQVSRSLCSCPLRAFMRSAHFGRRHYAQ